LNVLRVLPTYLLEVTLLHSSSNVHLFLASANVQNNKQPKLTTALYTTVS